MPGIRIHRLTWNGNDGEVLYAGTAAGVEQVRERLKRRGFRVGTPYIPHGHEGAPLHALPVVKTGCSLSELGDALSRDRDVAAVESGGPPFQRHERAGGRGGGDSHPGPAGLPRGPGVSALRPVVRG
jgi:hypothetical protein